MFKNLEINFFGTFFFLIRCLIRIKVSLDVTYRMIL